MNKHDKPYTISPPEDSYPEFIQEACQNYYSKRVEQSWQGEHILASKKPDGQALLLHSNDYLCLSQHPKLINSQKQALDRYGNQNMQSPVFLRHNDLLNQCEQELADWMRHPASLLAQSGWCANIALIQALARPNLPVYIDYQAHMSLWEGIRAAGAKTIPFRHNSTAVLEKRLQRFGSGIIAVDSIYSTSGSIAPIKEYCRLAREYKCLLVVDESHALGIYGPDGAGIVAELGLSGEVHLLTASLAKAMAGRAGVITGDVRLIELIRYNAYPTIFSTALMPHDLAGFISAVGIVKKESWRAEKLKKTAAGFREAMTAASLNLYGSRSHIVPLMCGSERQTIQLRRYLEDHNIFGSVFCSPATPVNKALIRLSLNCSHSEEALARIVELLLKCRKTYPDLLLYQSSVQSNCSPSVQ